jgi:hypothetical protein
MYGKELPMRTISLLILTASLAVMPACGGDEPIERPVDLHEEHGEWAHLDQSRKKETEAGTFTVEYVPEPDPIPFNELFSMKISVTGAPAPVTLAGFRVTMPSHGHGMNTRPKLSVLNAREFVVEGMQFQMEGHWEIKISPSAGGVTETAYFDVVCCAE